MPRDPAIRAQGPPVLQRVAALISADSAGVRQLDSAILIRTAEISADGALTAGTGATIVRHSNPASEAAETRSKAAGLLSVLTTRRELRSHPRVTEALASRNTGIGAFWLGHGPGRVPRTWRAAPRW